MAKFDISVTIKRPVEDVFAVISNPENAPKWQSGTLEAKQTSPGPHRRRHYDALRQYGPRPTH
jgi:uncharacterized protein YndB with AHSA1/START domain